MFRVLTVVSLLLLPAAANAQDAGAGEKVFAGCRACHQVGPTAKNLIGPELNGLMGRKAGSVAGFNYSSANKDSMVKCKNIASRSAPVKPRLPQSQGCHWLVTVSLRWLRLRRRCEPSPALGGAPAWRVAHPGPAWPSKSNRCRTARRCLFALSGSRCWPSR